MDPASDDFERSLLAHLLQNHAGERRSFAGRWVLKWEPLQLLEWTAALAKRLPSAEENKLEALERRTWNSSTGAPSGDASGSYGWDRKPTEWRHKTWEDYSDQEMQAQRG